MTEEHVGANRRAFMKRLMIASGATAVASMGGVATVQAMADDGTGTGATPSAEPTAAPTGGPGGPGGPGGGPGNLAVTDDFFGLTADGTKTDGLFTIRSEGVATAPVTAAAKAFLAGLSDAQKKETQFTIHSLEWRQWCNIDSYERNGVSLADLSDGQRALATALLKASLSAEGLETTEKIRKLNQAAGEAIGNTKSFNDEAFYFTVMGEPSATAPWGWQIDGHHLVINYFVLGDQVVMSPCFWGSEPTTMVIDGTKVSVCQDEIKAGLDFINSLTSEQKAVAIASADKSGESMVAGAFADNAVQAYTGVQGSELTAAQRTRLLALVESFVGKAKADVARAKMKEVRKHLADTRLTWAGGTAADSAFYCRVHSPVIWIELDCQSPGPLAGAYGAKQGDPATQMHVHAVVRTPNGNDYGKELLRQHYLTSPHHAH
ncbi:DUF3500 domain-containing protein [Streptomyces sp. NPDC021098]|uniref:DUF3500 domain-containing protein n=1 Tax=unclassified Streptomyces TaxID=2593676 RepID=UPI0037990085